MKIRLSVTRAVAIIFTATLLSTFYTYAQRHNVREEVAADWIKCSGLDAVYDFNSCSPNEKMKGYKPFYVSHYGRHGSRYAYTSRAYTELLEMLAEGEKKDNLTAFGKDVKARLDRLYGTIRYRVGDLTDKGWGQQKRMADRMASFYPAAFGKGSKVYACASSSIRSIMSMNSFCIELGRMAPETEIIAHQGLEYIQQTAPNMGTNPFRFKGPAAVFPYKETPDEFCLRRFPNYKDIYARMFTDPDKALKDKEPMDVLDHLYMLVAGMNSLTDDVKEDFSDIFTPEEYVTMWEVDNYFRFDEYYRYKTPCSAIYDDMINKAEERIANNGSGADLRFGHDHCLMTLLMIADLDHFAHVPENPDELAEWFHTFRSPMAGNIQIVFYRSKKANADILVRFLLNGEDVNVGDVKHYKGTFYRWEDIKGFLRAQIDSFCD